MRITRSHGKAEDLYKFQELPIKKRKKVIANKKQNEIILRLFKMKTLVMNFLLFNLLIIEYVAQCYSRSGFNSSS